MRMTLPLLLLVVIAVLAWLLVDVHERQRDLEQRVAASQRAVDQLTNVLHASRTRLRDALSGGEGTSFPRPGTTDCVLYLPGQFPTARPQPTHTGSVLAADAEANAYVISLGAEDGVKAGFVYIVSRNDQYVGMLSIDDVQAKQSAGRLLDDLSKGPARRNDTVSNGR